MRTRIHPQRTAVGCVMLVQNRPQCRESTAHELLACPIACVARIRPSLIECRSQRALLTGPHSAHVSRCNQRWSIPLHPSLNLVCFCCPQHSSTLLIPAPYSLVGCSESLLVMPRSRIKDLHQPPSLLGLVTPQNRAVASSSLE